MTKTLTDVEERIGNVEKNVASMGTKIVNIEKNTADMEGKLGAVNNEVRGLKTALIEGLMK